VLASDNVAEGSWRCRRPPVRVELQPLRRAIAPTDGIPILLDAATVGVENVDVGVKL
jgi:hypothetical protein